MTAFIGLAALSCFADATLFNDSNFDALRVNSVGSSPNKILSGTAPSFLFFPGEPVEFTIELERPKNGAPLFIELQAIHTRVPKKDTTRYIDPFGHPDMINLDGEPLRFPIDGVAWDSDGKATHTVSLALPDRFATYAILLGTGAGETPEERVLLGSLARIPRDRADATADNVPVFGEGQTEAFDEYGRMGIRIIRREIGWGSGLPAAEFDWSQYDDLASRLKAAGLRVMYTIGGVSPSRYGMAWGGPGVPAAVEPGWDGSPYWGQADWGCAPQYFDVYGEWVRAFIERYWEDGKGALWGVENYNEPWEGAGISGYARDCRVFADWQKILGAQAHAVSPDIKVCGACCIMNTEDKYFSWGRRDDGSYEMDDYVDVFTDHYVTPSMAYGPMVAAQHGKFSIENETWLVISEYLLPQVMCQWMAVGQRAVACWHPQVLFNEINGVRFPTTVPLATAAFNHFVTGKRFKKLVFQDHLPWLFQFGDDDDPDGVVVMLGQLLTRGGPTPQDNPKGRLWGQVDSVDGGTITVRNGRAFPLFGSQLLHFYDAAANEVHKGEKSVTLDLNLQPIYIKSPKGPAAIAEAFRDGVINGKYPVEIIPHDITETVSAGCEVRVEIANRLNSTVTGVLHADAPDGIALASNDIPLTLAAGETKEVSLTLATATADNGNQYPFSFVFDSDHGRCAYSETLVSTAVRKATPTIDGDLSEWRDIPGIVILGGKTGENLDELARRPWLRLRADLPETQLLAEVKLAWDEANLYVCAQVQDDSPQTNKVRMATRDDDAWFHSAASDNEEPWKSWLAEHAPGHSFAEVPYIYKKTPWQGLAQSGDNLQLTFNLLPGMHDLEPATGIPEGFSAIPDTDYEFCAYLCEDGEPEMWRLLAPGIPRIHSWPREIYDENPPWPLPGVVEGGKCVVRQDGNIRTYELAIPHAQLADLKLEAETKFKFGFIVNDDSGNWCDGPKCHFGEDKAVCKENGLTVHPYWHTSPSCSVEWKLVDSE